MSSKSNAIIWKAFEAIKFKEDNEIYRDYILAIFLLKYLSDKEANGSIILDTTANFDYIYRNRKVDHIGKLINDVLIEIDIKFQLDGIFNNLDFNSDANLGGINKRDERLSTMLEEMNKLDYTSKDSNPTEPFNYFIEAVEYYNKNLRYNFTPPELVKLISSLVDLRDNDTIYDPDCGYGSLLAYAYSEVNGAKLFGQTDEENLYRISKINMLINGIEDANIQLGSVINNPKHLEGNSLKKFDVAISNPVYMSKKWTNSFVPKFKTDPYNRFEFGIPSENKVEYVYISHMLNSLNDNGRMAILTIPSVLFREGLEGTIRKNLIENNLIDAIISLPPKLIAHTAIPYVIVLFKKNRKRKEIIMIDASSIDHVIKDSPIKNKLCIESSKQIIDAYKEFKDIDSLSRVVSLDEIRNNDYNLNIPKYILSNEDEIDPNSIKKGIRRVEEELSRMQNQIRKLIN